MRLVAAFARSREIAWDSRRATVGTGSAGIGEVNAHDFLEIQRVNCGGIGDRERYWRCALCARGRRKNGEGKEEADGPTGWAEWARKDGKGLGTERIRPKRFSKMLNDF